MLRMALRILLFLLIFFGAYTEAVPQIPGCFVCDREKAQTYAKALLVDRSEPRDFHNFLVLVDELFDCETKLGDLVTDKRELERIRAVIKKKDLINRACKSDREKEKWNAILNK